MSRQAPSNAGTSTQAVHNPVVREHAARELLSDDLPIREMTELDTDDSGGDVILATPEMLNADYAAELAFMEDVLTIYLNRGREKHSPQFEQFGVNGRIIWVQVEQPTNVKRKYVEVMARSMPVDITTQSGESPGDELVFNKVQRHQTANFSFSILHDPSPKGAAWLAKVRREN
jgi:hypothetical protein